MMRYAPGSTPARTTWSATPSPGSRTPRPAAARPPPLAPRRQARTLTSAKASSILHRFRQHLAGRFTVVEITPALFHEAMRLANTHALRASDAVQLAAVLEIDQKEQDAGFAPVTL